MTFVLFVLLFAVTLGAAGSVLGAPLDGAIMVGGLAGLVMFVVLTVNKDRL